MKRLKRHRGITLVEVLVSLILIGVIAAGFLTFFSGSFNNILRQRSQNAINFDIQESFEKQLAEKTVTDGGVCPEFPDLLFFYNLGKV